MGVTVFWRLSYLSAHSGRMSSPMKWNDPARTWRQGSYQPPTERRTAKSDRRGDTRRSAIGERRTISRRVLASLLRL